jgi:hypothetical protein
LSSDATFNITVDDAPEVSSISGDQSSPTNADSLTFSVTFDEAVTGVDSGDFTVSGPAGSATAVSGSGTDYTVTVSGGDLASFSGDVTLTLSDDDSIASSGNSVELGGVGTSGSGDGSTTSSAVTVDNTAPAAPTNITEEGSSDLDDSTLNASEDDSTTFRVSLPGGSDGTEAASGDSVELLLGGASFSPAETVTLSSSDISTGHVDFTVDAADLGSDGSKSLTAQITDAAGNVGTASAALTFELRV